MTTFKHAGVDISLDPVTGKFGAVMEGKKVAAPSLDAMKKKIDGVVKAGFKQFVAYKDQGRHQPAKDRYKEVVVVGVKRARANTFRGESFWITSTGEHLNTVYEFSPESLAALRARDALIEKQRAEKEAMDKAHSEARAKATNALRTVPL